MQTKQEFTMFDWTTMASIATAIGVSIAVFELRESQKIAQTQFEDSMDQQYRELAKDIPVDALIGKRVNDKQKLLTRELIYNYLDLSNEQIFLRKKKRIRYDTWLDWQAGIQSHLQKVEFKTVWDEVKAQSAGTFTSLERLEKMNFSEDPSKWE